MLRRNLPLLTTLGVLLALLAGASLLYEGFAAPRTFANLLGDNATLGLAALGMTLVILSGGIDLSVGAVVSLTTVLLAVLVQNAGLHPAAAAALCLLPGAALGAAQGALIHYCALPAFLVTLSGMFLARGLAFAVSSESLPLAHPFHQALTAWSLPLGGGAALTAGAVLWLVCAAVFVLGVHRTPFGRDVFALGGNETAASLMGVPTARTRIAVYTLNGACAALAGLCATLFTGSGNPTAGFGLELDAIAAVVIGGTVLTGGAGTVAGTCLGVLICGTLQMALIFDGRLNSWWQRIVAGGLLLAFILVQRVLSLRRAQPAAVQATKGRC